MTATTSPLRRLVTGFGHTVLGALIITGAFFVFIVCVSIWQALELKLAFLGTLSPLQWAAIIGGAVMCYAVGRVATALT